MTILALALAAAALPLQVEMQRLEASRNAAIHAGDMATLERLYSPDFHGIAAGGAEVDRPALLAIFRRNVGGAWTAESEISRAREVNGLIVAEGRLRLYSTPDHRLISDSLYMHLFRRVDGHWQMVAGAASPIPVTP